MIATKSEHVLVAVLGSQSFTTVELLRVALKGFLDAAKRTNSRKHGSHDSLPISRRNSKAYGAQEVFRVKVRLP